MLFEADGGRISRGKCNDMAKKKMAMQKEIIFPCGDKLVATSDYGHAYGLVVAHEPVDGEDGEKFINQCKGCAKCNKTVCIRNYREKATGKEKKYKDTICVGYSQTYLDNKDRPTTKWIVVLTICWKRPREKTTHAIISLCSTLRTDKLTTSNLRMKTR